MLRDKVFQETYRRVGEIAGPSRGPWTIPQIGPFTAAPHPGTQPLEIEVFDVSQDNLTMPEVN